MKLFPTMAAAVLLAGSALSLPAAHAQGPGIGRVDLVAQDSSAPGRQIVQVRVDFAPGAFAPKHVHPGEEVAFVLEGTLEYQLNEQPPVTLHSGQSLFIPAGTKHSARNVGNGVAKELASYFVEKGQPLVVLDK